MIDPDFATLTVNVLTMAVIVVIVTMAVLARDKRRRG